MPSSMRWCSGAIRRRLLAASGRIWKRAPVKSAFGRSMRSETRKRTTEPCRRWPMFEPFEAPGIQRVSADDSASSIQQIGGRIGFRPSHRSGPCPRERLHGQPACYRLRRQDGASVRRRERRRGQDLVILQRHRAPTSGPREGVVEQPALTALVSKSLRYSRARARCRSRRCRAGRPRGRFWGQQSESSQPGRGDGCASDVCR